jgi:hypothetical protein
LRFIGFAVIVNTVTSEVLTPVGAHLAREAGLRWQPTMAYFTGKALCGKEGTKPSEPDGET